MTCASIHVPKTIDNDLMENDHAPGFPSAARFVAQAFMGADLDNRALPGVYVAVVMGRNAGFLTAASSAARTIEGDGPHLIYLPERDFDTAKFLSEVKTVHDRLGRCVIAVSEGIRDADGTPLSVKLAQTAEKDAHGNVHLSGTGALADFCAPRSNPSSASRACAAIRSAISSAPSPAAFRTWIGARRAKSANSRSADRRLCRRLHLGSAGQGRRQDQSGAGCVHRRLGQRRHARFPGTICGRCSAAIYRSLMPRLRGGTQLQGAEAVRTRHHR